ncbi:hypothetical protein CCACVL1_10541, partial [Corchorus capsularis]
ANLNIKYSIGNWDGKGQAPRPRWNWWDWGLKTLGAQPTAGART